MARHAPHQPAAASFDGQPEKHALFGEAAAGLQVSAHVGVGEQLLRGGNRVAAAPGGQSMRGVGLPGRAILQLCLLRRIGARRAQRHLARHAAARGSQQVGRCHCRQCDHQHYRPRCGVRDTIAAACQQGWQGQHSRSGALPPVTSSRIGSSAVAGCRHRGIVRRGANARPQVHAGNAETLIMGLAGATCCDARHVLQP